MNNQKEEYAGRDRRRFPRLRACIVEYTPLGKVLPSEICFSENISSGGICIFIADDLDVDTLLGLKIFLPYYEDPLKAKGKIVWKKESSFMGKRGVENYDIGIEFTEIEDEDRKSIDAYIRKYSRKKVEVEDLDIIS